ncbi:restriction endonuclease subunit S [Limosilactobacillus antri]|uniref:restriction endonuclease subunit S n=1 Tax=Limosilactobacillus antri TaxID=227943 RepID=UPI001F56E298|nr:restriction endonuclease subunit S [Limosilactobacillus antri]
MSKTKKVPNLRFQGFTDDWEQHKLGDALEEFSYGLNTPATKFDGKNKYLRITDIDDDTHAFNQTSLTSPKDKDDNYILGQGDILFARTGASVGKTYMYKANDGKVYYAGFLIKGHIKNGFSTEFIFNTTRLPQYQNFVKVTSMRSGQPGINAKEYQNYVIYVPVKQEQERIGQLISKLDTLITLHQHKLDQLRVLKEILLQKLFANDQHDKPELRFKDFTDKWEKVKIGSLFTESTEKSATGQLLSVSINKGVYPFDETERKNNSSKNKSNYKFVEKYDIAYNSMRMWQGAEGVSYYSGIVSPAYTVLKPQQNSNPEFYAYMFKRAEMLNKFRRYSQGLTSDTWNLKFPILKTISLRTTDIKEQEKIVQLLRMVKDNISLQQKKLTQYQQAKKFLLQQMFI